MIQTSLKPLFCLLILSVAILPGCIRKQEESASAVQVAPAEDQAANFEGAAIEVAIPEVAAPDRSDATEVRSKLDGRIEWVVKNGTSVKQGDVLVRFASRDLERSITEITTASHIAKAELAKSEAAVSSAELALVEYVEGLIPLAEEEINVEIVEAELRLRVAGDNKEQAELARAHLKLAQKKLDVLRKFTTPKQTEGFKGALAIAKAELQARAEQLRLLQSRRDRLIEQLKSSVVKAPVAGQVFLADENGIRTGVVVRKGQVLIYLNETN